MHRKRSSTVKRNQDTFGIIAKKKYDVLEYVIGANDLHGFEGKICSVYLYVEKFDEKFYEWLGMRGKKIDDRVVFRHNFSFVGTLSGNIFLGQHDKSRKRTIPTKIPNKSAIEITQIVEDTLRKCIDEYHQ